MADLSFLFCVSVKPFAILTGAVFPCFSCAGGRGCFGVVTMGLGLVEGQPRLNGLACAIKKESDYFILFHVGLLSPCLLRVV